MTESLKGDESRQAAAALRGYRYQILRSIHEWLTLAEGEILFLEGAEDFDRVSATHAEATQVKNVASRTKLTLRSAAAVAAIDSCWQLVKSNPGRTLWVNFLTTAATGIEEGAPFGPARPGIQVWEEASRAGGPHADVNAEELRVFLVGEGRVSDDLLQFLGSASASDVRQQLLSHLAWHTNEPSIGDVEAAVLRKLRAVCWERKVSVAYAEKIRDSLERMTWLTATKAADRALRIEDFFRVFDEVTTVPVPYGTLEALLTSVSALQMSGMRSLGTSSAAVSIVSVSRTGPPPPLIGKRIARGSLKQQIADALQKCGLAYVHGTSGTGKTTQAALFAHGDREAFVWVNCRDADEDQLRSQLDVVGRRVDTEPRYRYVVADDVDGVRHGRPLEELLPGLLYTLRQRSGGLVLTGDRPASQRLSNVLGLAVGSSIAVGLFTESEVRLLLLEYGATESGRLSVWARLILAKTSGHPQLVAAYISALAQSCFADPTVEDLLGTPTEIASAREETRLVLANTLSPAHRDLLYRLSLLTGPFARNRAIALAAVDPALPEPGDLFDLLVGPWIERVTEKEYRLSPLLLNAGSRANSETWTKSTYAAIATTWTRFSQQTPWDISTILFSATLGGNTQAIARLAMGLTSAKKEVWDTLGEADMVFVHCYTGAGQSFPGTSLEVFYARWVQLQLSARGNAKTYLAIMDRIEESFPRSATDPKLRVLRHMLLLQSIVSPVDALPIRRLIRIITDVEESWQFILEELRQAAERSGATSEAAKLRTNTDVPNVLSVTLLRRVKTCDELIDLVPALDEMAPQLRSRCLALFLEHPDMGRQLADAIWLSEYQSAAPRWDSLVKSLQQLCEAAVRWGELTLAQAVTSVLARVLHEQLSESQRSLEILAAAPRGGMGAYLVVSEQAKILSQTGDVTRAIALWTEALAGAHADPNANVVGTALVARSAAIAAANAGDFSRAAEFAETALTAARGAADAKLIVGILADASHAQWRTGNSTRSVRLMAEALERLGTVPNSPKDVRDYYAHKAVGHLVTWMAGQAKSENSRLPEPSFGSCSYLEPSERVLDVNPTPLEFSQAGLIALAQSVGVPLREFAPILQRLRVAPYASVRFRVVESELAEAISTGNVAGVVDLVAALIATLIASREERDSGEPLWVPKPAIERESLVNAREWMDPDFWILQLCNALLALATAGSPIVSGIGTWHARAQAVRAPAALYEWIRSIEQLAGRDERTWLAALRNSSGHWSERIVAGALILDGQAPDARFILRAHDALLELHESALANQFEAGVCRAVSHAWREAATKRPFALCAPRVHVPHILEACDSAGDSWTKAARIFLAAAPAVDLRVPQSIASRVRGLAGEP
jgi:hypothetical protein